METKNKAEVKQLENYYWIQYRTKASEISVDGKWIVFFKKNDYKKAKFVCKDIVERGIVKVCKMSSEEPWSLKNPNAEKDDEGVLIIYTNQSDTEEHKNIFRYLIEKEMIMTRYDGSLHDVDFKTEQQTRNGEYGVTFTPYIRMSDYVDLKTKEFL